jgi:hypothetical protein
MVNRIWMHHFGKGLVNTPGDWGFNGDRPSHPELLDWLAADFVANGWRMKRLHRLIVTSTTYRQQSRRTPELDAIDPDNRLLARMSIRRLDAESVRDALLAASGELNPVMYGRSVPVAEDSEGRVVVGKAGRLRGGTYASTAESVGDQAARRSIYIETKRALPLGMLEAFDLPVMTPNCDARRCSTVATQSLLFLNDQGVIGRAEKMAERLKTERADDPARVRRAFALLYGWEPTETELADCLAFLQSQTERFRTQAESQDPAGQALAALCQTLMCANRFLYVD